MEGLNGWELAGIVAGIAVGAVTIISLALVVGMRLGRLVTRDDLYLACQGLEKKIDDQAMRLEKKIDDETSRLEKKIDDSNERMDRRIDDETSRLEKKIDDSNERMDRRIDEVLLAIQNLGNRLEATIMEHTHDEEGVAVFRRHPQMVDAAD